MTDLIDNGWYEPTPVGWSVQRMKNIMSPKEERSVDGNEELLSVTINEGIIKRSEYLDEDEGTSRADSLVGYKVVNPTNLVNNIMKMSFRCLGVSRYEGIVSPAYSVFNLDQTKIDPSYLNYLLRIDRYIAEYRKLSKGIQESRMRLYDDFFLAMKVVVPPLDEQQRISRYLDKKTAQVDSLIDKIQKKIDLYKDQRTTLINQCVTKGLNPDVEMFDSGIESIGRFPKHWKLSKYKYEITIQNGYPFKSELFDGESGFPLIRIRDVTSGSIESFYTGEPLPDFIVKKGDLLVGMDGDFNTRWWMGQDALLNQRVCRIFEGKLLNRRYISYILPTQLKVINDLTYYTTVKHLSSFDVLETKTLVPPIDEQEKIVEFLDEQTGKIDKAISLETQRISLLKEYRQSLISSGVTGRVRVTKEMI